MEKFTATIHQFGEQGEKTGWTYIEVPESVTEKLQPGKKKSYRVKGKLDKYSIAAVALIPMGGGRFIIPLNTAMRKGISKKKGAVLQVALAYDPEPLKAPAGFLECLEDEPEAKHFFDSLKQSNRTYFIKWMAGVKSENAVAKRMAQVIKALAQQQDFVAMIRSHKEERDRFGR
jgi:Domain of unknown function (DUF1905)/Bacteriocin-protection, YdeI or OmpD-Associated